MGQVCTWGVRIYAALWLIAVLLFAIGTFGLFGQERDPLSGVFLLPLGLPWNLWVDVLRDALRAPTIVAAPVLNICVLAAICRRLHGSNREDNER